MSNPKRPDDFDDLSKTTPFVDPSKKPTDQASKPESGWEKTNYIKIDNPREIPMSSWEKDEPAPESDKTSAFTYIPPASSQREEIDKTRDYGLQTQSKPVTTESIHRPSTEQTQKSASAVANRDEHKSEEKVNLIPPKFMYILVIIIFLLLAGTMIISYLLFYKKHGFDVVLVGAHPNSDAFVDGVRWGISSSDGSIRLLGLRAGEHKIEVRNPSYLYDTETIRGDDGEQVKVTLKYRSKTTPTPQPVPDECSNIRKGEFEKAARCANEALDKLGDKFTVEELLRAMNLYIINFDSGKYDIKPKDMSFLEKAAGYMKKLPPNVKIEVGGHTDNVGDDASNMKLSENRAKAVRDALIGFGVRPDLLEVRGYGETRPKASNDTEDGRFQNRRIEYTAIIRSN